MVSPHLSLRLAVGLAAALLAVTGTYVAVSCPGFPDPLRLWVPRFRRRLVTDLRATDGATVAWVAVAVVSVTVTSLHFGGLHFGVYDALPWWDLLTHWLGGAGVAGTVYLSHRTHPVAGTSVAWVVATVVAVGAWFEVYEFLFKTFWYDWTFQFYLVDTITDLGVDTLGALSTAAVVVVARSDETPRPRVDETSE